jgi:outer membrane protein assembly factor BamD (BamD/ComL family)
MRLQYTLLLIIGLASTVIAQKPTKIFEKSIFAGMDASDQATIDKEMDDARVDLAKVLLKDSTDAMANMGMSVIYSFDTYSRKDYYKAWAYFKKADAAQEKFTPEDKEVLNTYFFKQSKERRGRPINKNMELERKLVEEKLIKFVREENNLQYAIQFLKEFPDSKYYTNVEHIRNYIEFRTAENTGTVDAFNQFLKKYPHSAQVRQAIEERDAIAFDQAKKTNTVAAFGEFIKNYPQALQVEEAKKIVSILAYEEAAKVHTLKAIEGFMAEYPNSPKMPDAKILQRQLLFEWAKSVNSLEAYNQFVAQYPEGELYVDIFNLKTQALGQKVLMELPMDNYKMVRGYDNQQLADFGGAVALRNDGQLVVVINTPRNKDEMIDSWFIYQGADGKMKWNKILGNDFDDVVNVITLNDKNEIFAAGSTNAIIDSVPGQSWYYKLDATGKNIFNCKLDGNEILDMVMYPDGKALFGSYIQKPGDSLPIPLIIKVNTQGRKLWSRTYAPGHKVTSLTVNGEQTYLAMGNWTMTIDEMGYIKWDKAMPVGCEVSSVAVNTSGKVVFTGVKDSTGYAVSFDASGKQQWEVSFATPKTGNFKQSCALTDGSVISAGTFGNKVQLVRLDGSGKVLFTKTLETSKPITFNRMVAGTDNSVWLSLTWDGSDVVVLKLGL